MAKSEPRYDAGYPLAIELVYAQKLSDNTRIFCKWVRDACIKTYKAIGKSGAVLNTDAADGKDISVDDLLGDFIAAATVKKVRVYIKKKAGRNYSRMTREQQERLIRDVAKLIAPDAKPFLRAMPELLKDGEFGAVPAFTMSEVGRMLGLAIVKDFASVTGTNPDMHIRAINHAADEIQTAIVNGNFGFTDKYWQDYYQRFRVDGVKLIDLKKGLPTTPDTAGAISEKLGKLSEPLRTSSVIPSLPAMDKTSQQLTENGVRDIELIIKASADIELAPDIKLPVEKMGDVLGVDFYAGDELLKKEYASWVEESMGRMQNINDEALQRGIKVIQQGMHEGMGGTWVEENLIKEMDISVRRASNVARNEVGNHAWFMSHASARRFGGKYYRWEGRLDERERKSHLAREGKAYSPDMPPPDGNPGQPFNCRCVARWLLAKSDVEEAEKEIAARNTGQR